MMNVLDAAFGHPRGPLGRLGGVIMVRSTGKRNEWTLSLLDIQRDDRVLEYTTLDHPLVQARLLLPPDQFQHQLHPDPARTTEFAPAVPEIKEQPSRTCGYGKPTVAARWKADRFSGQDFALQPDGTLRCPANQSPTAHERRRETDGSLRVVYAGSHRSCRPCPLRAQCQWNGTATAKPRQVSVLLHPVVVGSAPVLWRDWSRRVHRRACMQLLRHQRVKVQVQSGDATPIVIPAPLSRAQRAHSRLSWDERLARNARAPSGARPTITLFGVPDAFAAFLGLRAS